MGLLLLILALILIFGGIPVTRSYDPRYGFSLSGIGLILIILLVVLLFNHTVVIW